MAMGAAITTNHYESSELVGGLQLVDGSVIRSVIGLASQRAGGSVIEPVRQSVS